MSTLRRSPTLASVTDLEVYLAAVVDRLSAALQDDLAAVYLHGSAAMDAFVPSRSDVDVLVVTRGPLGANAKSVLAQSLSERSLPCPGVGLELSIVTASAARTPSDRPLFELHVSTAEGKVVDGVGRPGDPDLVAHFAMTRERGDVLFGPPADQVISPIDRSRLLLVMADDLAWALERELGGYAVLNACRALRFARESTLGSKPEGGAWAVANGVGDRASIDAALRRQAGSDEIVDLGEATSFVELAREELVAEAGR
jgi:streptomycin 3"-adenylyltransferase